MDHPPMSKRGAHGEKPPPPGRAPRKLHGFTAYSMQNIPCRFVVFNTVFLQIVPHIGKSLGMITWAIPPPLPT